MQETANQVVLVKSNKAGKIVWFSTFIFIIPIFSHIRYRNNILRMEAKVNESDSTIDVQLTQRSEMLEKLVDTTKQSMKWEQSVLTEIVNLRSANVKKLDIKEKAELNNKMDDLQKNINVQLEAYPTLTSTEVIKQLQKGIQDAENNLAAARRIYNSNVSIYNQEIQIYPKNIAASQMNRATKMFFEANEKQKSDVKINLG